eukprot:1303694-Rhodomonas_salina.1
MPNPQSESVPCMTIDGISRSSRGPSRWGNHDAVGVSEHQLLERGSAQPCCRRCFCSDICSASKVCLLSDTAQEYPSRLSCSDLGRRLGNAVDSGRSTLQSVCITSGEPYAAPRCP